MESSAALTGGNVTLYTIDEDAAPALFIAAVVASPAITCVVLVPISCPLLPI